MQHFVYISITSTLNAVFIFSLGLSEDLNIELTAENNTEYKMTKHGVLIFYFAFTTIQSNINQQETGSC